MSPGSSGRFPLLAGDFGGTNARFGWVRHAGAPLSEVVSLLCAEYPRPEDAARNYLDRYQADVCPAYAAIAIAGAVSGGPVKVTNSHRVLDYLRAISTPVITATNPGLQGLARTVATP